MNGGVIAAIVRRDLLTMRRNPGVLIPMIVVPLVLVVVLPVATYAVGQVEALPDALMRLLELAPEGLLAGLPGDATIRLSVLVAIYVVPFLMLIIPLVVASVMATDAIAGERERDTLEGLLLAPVSDREILAGKLLGALVPALVVLAVVSALYAVVVDALFWSEAGGPILPNGPWLLTVLWFGPAFTAAALGLTLIVSARATSVQGASQVSGIAVFPLMAMAVSQLAGFVLFEWWVTLAVGGLLWLLAAGLIGSGARILERERQITSLP